MKRRLLWLAMLWPATAHAADVTALQPWVRYLLPSLPAAGYVTLHNSGAADETITAAASPACGSVMLHQSQDNSGTAMMMDVPSITIPAGGGVAFAPGGYHLMCMQPKMRPGDRVMITLTLQPQGKLSFTAPVYGADAAP